MSLSAEKITELCDNWFTASHRPGGGVMTTSDIDKYRLTTNGIVFHELDYNALEAALIGTSKRLLLPGKNVFIDDDHILLWSWCGELLHYSNSAPPEQANIKNLFELAIHAVLVSSERAVFDERNIQPQHSKAILNKADLILSYIVFPLLDAILKRACKQFISFDGKVLYEFSVPKSNHDDYNLKIKKYGPDIKNSNICSNIRDLLILYQTTIIDNKLNEAIDRFNDNFKVIDQTKMPFDLIHDWRNDSLHGSASHQTIGGALLSLCLLISLSELREHFDKYRDERWKIANWNMQTDCAAPWSFYRPY